MIALKVFKNGVLLCTAGADDLGVLHTNVAASGLLGPKSKKSGDDQAVDLTMHIGGLTARHEGSDDHLAWRNEVKLELGDTIAIQYVEAAVADPPDRVSAYDQQRAEQRLKERYQYAKEVYLQFRDRFEIGGD